MRRLQDRSFLAFAIAVTLLFAWILQSFFGAILRGIVAAILFKPVNDHLLRAWPTHRNPAALVGRDTRLPDYVVLVSTLGGLEVFGFNGFIIGPVVAALFMAVWEILARQNSRAEPASTVPIRGFVAFHAEQAPS